VGQHFAIYGLILDMQKRYNQSKYITRIVEISSFYILIYIQDCYYGTREKSHQSQKNGEIFASSCKWREKETQAHKNGRKD
jgi:hypothetical protein